MLNRSILVRGAFIGLLLAGFLALADGIARVELAKAVNASQNDNTRTIVVHVAGAED